ncbi:DNA-binding GntR family transcriptional regulator [Streptomyces umbrinus]|uniref:DNA-binding GntR family transcriptional regulator n=1 Tax=Streptomyces umbrinus TaxID=67370 RepID=A0ABU0T9L2_9ACTN|nr:GntR family transcriptional regulator [Streptomyces umbrinus]MDQ1031479.1 DNA-binding GntR family transcriptional regulator [Streptomyces umbrinus]
MTPELITKTIKRRVADGTYGRGTALPAEKALAAEFGVSHWTLRQALQPLKDTGVVHAISGRGNLVPDPQATQSAARQVQGITKIIRERLADGTYAVGTWLPGTSVLAAEFDVSPNTVQAALRSLKQEKLLAALNPQGTYVIDPQHPCAPPPAAQSHHVAIAKVIRVRLRNGTYPPGSRLPTYAELASEFGAGHTTISNALQLLRKEGLVSERQRSKRVYAVRSASEHPGADRNVTGEIERIVRSRLSDGTYAVGTWLPSARTLAAEFGVCHATIREALAPLKGEKLLASLETLGTYVVDPQQPGVPPPGMTSRTVVYVGKVLRERLRDGTYPPGSRLPTNVELATEFDVGVNTISRAINPLRSEGLVLSGLHFRVCAARPACEPSGLASNATRVLDGDLKRGFDHA